MISLLHHWQYRGKCTSFVVPGMTFVFVFPWQIGQRRNPFSFTLTPSPPSSLAEQAGLEPARRNPSANGLQSAAVPVMLTVPYWSRRQGSNPHPDDYKSPAPPVVLLRHFCVNCFLTPRIPKSPGLFSCTPAEGRQSRTADGRKII